MDEDDYLSQAVLLVENDEVNEFSEVLLTMDVVDSVTMNTDQVFKLYTDEVDSTASNYDSMEAWYLNEELEVVES
jgi:DNA polymerase III psi subunit